MSKNSDEYSRYFPKIFGAIIMFSFMASYLITRGDKPREDFIHIDGTISHLSKEPPFQFSGRKNKKVYLTINEYNRVFELFTGTDKGDFSPRVNQLEKLKIGDKIDIYFEISNQTKSQPVNRLLQYLDKDGELIYLRSKADKYIGYSILGISGILLVILIYMKIKSK